MQGPIGLQQSLRDRAIRADLTSTLSVAFGELWSGLVTGHYSIFDWFFTEQRCILVLASEARRPKPPLDPRCREALEGAILASGQKPVAFNSGHSVSTVSGRCSQALKYVNSGTTYSKIPIALVVVVYAARELSSPRVARHSFLTDDGGGLLVTSFPRPDAVLEGLVPPGEAEVARLCIEGHSHAQIATLRKTSSRTVANQLAAVYAKANVSGRAELLAKLTQSYLGTPGVATNQNRGGADGSWRSLAAFSNNGRRVGFNWGLRPLRPAQPGTAAG